MEARAVKKKCDSFNNFVDKTTNIQPSNILLLEEYLKSQEIFHVKRKM